MTATPTRAATATATDPADSAAIERAFVVAQAALADPTILDEIPTGATLVVLRAEDDPATVEEQLTIALRAARRGSNVYIRHLAAGEWVSPSGCKRQGECTG